MDTSRKGKGGGAMTREAVVVEQSGVHETRNSSPLARRRLLLVGSHVVQYSSPIFQKLAQDPRLEILVAYCSMQGAEACVDPEFGVEVAWDTPLFEGYPGCTCQTALSAQDSDASSDCSIRACGC